MTPEQQETHNEALSQLRKLEIDKALVLFYQILSARPNDIKIIDQIYKLQIRNQQPDSFNRLANHIFSLSDKSKLIHPIMIEAYLEFKKRNPKTYFDSLSDIQTFNLLYHLGTTTYQSDAKKLVSLIKSKYSEHSDTPESLFVFSEHLIEKKMFIQAKTELEFLMVYYTEAKTQIPAEKLAKFVSANIHS